MKKVTIIIPVYNAEQYLHRCVDSLLKQTYTNIELILVDDGSSDNSSKICDEYCAKDKRINVIHKTNNGVSEARNSGLKVATGDYIGFVDSDDFVEESFVEDMMIGDYDIIVSGYRAISEKQEEIILPKEIEYKNQNKEFFTAAFCNNYFNAVWNKLFKKSVIKDIGFDKEFNFGEDYKFNIQALDNATNIVSVPIANYNYVIFQNSNSICKKEKIYRKISSYIMQTEMAEDLLQDKMSAEIYSVFLRCIFYTLREYLKNNNDDKVVRQEYLATTLTNEVVKKIVNRSKMFGFKDKIVKKLMSLKNIKMFEFICKII